MLMISNLFSVFEPSSFLGLPLNWCASFCVVLLLPANFWMGQSQSRAFLKSLSHLFVSEVKAMFGAAGAPGVSLGFTAVLIYLCLVNFSGLLPYIFTPSSHLWFTVALALPWWVGHVSYASWRTPNAVLAHLVPLSTPIPLMPFMVLIELTSSVIRPLTLSVRLAANMVAGHLLMTLLSAGVPASGWSVLSLALTALVGLAVLETAVAFIQAYVFSVLSALYVNEVTHKDLV